MKRLLIFSLLLTLALAALPATAQEEDVPIKGDADSANLSVVRDFLAENFNRDYLATDVVYDDPAFPDSVQGLTDLVETQSLFFGEAFSEVEIDPALYVVADDAVVAEFYYIADHTGPYYGATASGRRVAFQVAGVFEVSDGLISDMRLYYDVASINSQLGYTPAVGAPVPAVTADGVEIVDVDDIEEDLNEYVGDVVRVSGEVDEILSDWAFVLEDEDIFDLTGQEYVLVLAGSSGVFEFGYGEGESITVVGTVQTFDLEELQPQLEYELDADLLADYSDLPVVVNDVDIE